MPQNSTATLKRETLFSGNAADKWDSGRDGGRMAAEYLHHEIKPEGNAVRWSFAPRADSFADMFVRPQIKIPFKELVLKLRNTGAPFELAVKLVDSGNADYVVPAISVQATPEWQQVSFTWDQFALGSWSQDPDRKISLPIQSMAVIAYGIKSGQEYRLDIADISVLRVPPARIKATVIAPASAVAGKTLSIRGSITPVKEYRSEGANELQLVHGEQVVARVPITLPAVWKAGRALPFGPVKLQVPEFAWGGLHSIVLSLGYASVEGIGGTPVLAKLKVQARRPGKGVATVQPYGGVPTLHINGKPDAAMSYMSYNPNTRYYTQFGKAGVHLYTFSATPTESGYTLSRETWTAPNTWDYSQTDERSMKVLSSDPEAHFFPRLYLRAPKWWTDAHPDELVTYDPGDGKPIPFLHSENRPVPSWASEVWRKDTAMAIQRYIRHMEGSPWSDRVIGYHIASGTTEEWMMWGGNENQWVDYSRPNREAFHRWLKAKYQSVDALRTAWGDASVTFETAPIPTKAQRSDAAIFSLHDPAKEQSVIDYTLYNSDLVVETIAYFAKVVKDATRREKLVGAFYGYVLQLAAEQRQQNAGHLSLLKLLNCPDVDFMTSPTSYAFRDPGTGYTHFMSLTDSVRAHGKLWMDENDYKTWITPGPLVEWGKTASCEESIQQQQREFACVMGHSCGKWWFDMGGGWYDDPRMMSSIGEMAAIAGKSLAWDRSPADQVAYIVDPHSLAWLRTGNALSGPLIMQQLPLIGRMGAPFGCYLLDDLERIPDHRMYVFISCFAPTDAQRKMIDKVVKHGGRVAVWVYAPGIYQDGQLAPAGMQSLTGIHLEMAREEAPMQVQISGTDPLLAGLPSGLVYGSELVNGPVVYANDPLVRQHGKLVKGGQAGLVSLQMRGWTSVFSSAPMLPTGLLRNLARMAGVHLYTEGDEVVWANRSMLAVNVNVGGPRTVRLPRAARVTELFSGKLIGTGIRDFTADIPDKGTALYHLG